MHRINCNNGIKVVTNTLIDLIIVIVCCLFTESEGIQFREIVLWQAKHYSTNHLMVTMGSDFQYQAAHNWYLNLDKLIKYVNARVSLGAGLPLHFFNFLLHFLHQSFGHWY